MLSDFSFTSPQDILKGLTGNMGGMTGKSEMGDTPGKNDMGGMHGKSNVGAMLDKGDMSGMPGKERYEGDEYVGSGGIPGR
jgi:hypothetical protein